MASGIYLNGLEAILNGTIDPDTTPLKLLLLSTEYVFDRTHANVAALTAGGGEVTATGYAGGFNGAGRKTVAVTVTRQNVNGRVVLILADTTWTALGGAANDTVAAAALVREVTSDAASIPIAYLDITDTPTNGSDLTLDYDQVDGNIRFTVP